ncbi:glutathione S-transferase family protein [Variovorax sp. HJSM1_2]|uniref:glutathione S-transferase family protein n=1 Tax=Variovorax sp. HJSM1_2 TaxID=3366263 RepID=UPI003BBD1AF8
MIEFHYWPTPNGWRVSIMLEECALPYQMVPVNIGRGEQFTPEFMALIGPHNRMPAVVDHQAGEGAAPITVVESGAILTYLAEKTQRFLPVSGPARYETLQWLAWHYGNLSPACAQNIHFRRYAPSDSGANAYAVDHFTREVHRLYVVLEAQLEKTGAYVAGAEFSIADIAILPTVRLHTGHEIDLANFPHVQRWYNQVSAREAVQRGLNLGQELRAPVLSAQARLALFGDNDPEPPAPEVDEGT